ncbi:hypothetical protein [Oceanobacillus neutriphilus]|uniref:Lipoprotein n=1 Tax=Oceanobacillus neutriphilus TaxID=531815 RepID=A0ABQ2NQK5_9BACI|nr:hypothetical protein [Oceanobacillus neutriphilus]GGP08384.1 hypothetical protein GCM10011346_08210 [Oceanobacillus neutriphilus]
MKFAGRFLAIIIAFTALTGCSEILNSEELLGAEEEVALNSDTGEGTLELETPIITDGDTEIKIKMTDINEEKNTFITVANETVFEGNIKNNEVYTLDISDIKDALRTDYDPKVQLLQTSNDEETGDIVTFKQVRYSVE